MSAKTYPIFHAGVLHALCVQLAKSFFQRREADPRTNQYRYEENEKGESVGPLDIAPIESSLETRDAQNRPTLYAGAVPNETVGRQQLYNDTRSGGSSHFLREVKTSALFRLDTSAPDDGRWVMAEFMLFLCAMQDPVLQEYGAGLGSLRTFSPVGQKGPTKVTSGSGDNAQVIWRTEILVEVEYFLSYTLDARVLPLREVMQSSQLTKPDA